MFAENTILHFSKKVNDYMGVSEYHRKNDDISQKIHMIMDIKCLTNNIIMVIIGASRRKEDNTRCCKS